MAGSQFDPDTKFLVVVGPSDPTLFGGSLKLTQQMRVQLGVYGV